MKPNQLNQSTAKENLKSSTQDLATPSSQTSTDNSPENLKLTPWQRIRAHLPKPAVLEVPPQVIVNVHQVGSEEDRQHNTSNTIHGALTTIPIPELFPFLHRQRQTGVLRLHFDDSRLDSQFHFVGGKLSYVRTPFAPGLGNMLQRLKLSPDELSKMRHYLKADPQERLELRPYIDMVSLEDVIHSRLMMALLPLFYIQDGRFSFQRVGRGLQLTDKLFDAQMLCFQVSQRLEHIAALGANTLTPDNAFHVVQDVGDFTRKTSDFTMLEWRVLASLFKPKMLLTLALELNLGWDKLLETVLLLEQRGILEQYHSSNLAQNLPQLIPGQVAPMFSLATMSERMFSLGELRGQHTVLIFFRHAGARICNAQIAKLSQYADKLNALGVRLIGVFTATPNTMRASVGRQELVQDLSPYHTAEWQLSPPPIILLADADNAVHHLYKVSHSRLGLLDPRNLPALLKGMRLATRTETYGRPSQMPATFFIGPSLRIERAFYGSFANDHVSLQQIESWLGAVS
ncbi:MAG: redoxin domain-containing protein [Deinococcota bacterium]